jgi:hypothetical protein
VPLEISGCYVKFNFPNELQVSAELTGFTGAEQMLSATGTPDISPVDSDLTSETNRYVIL